MLNLPYLKLRVAVAAISLLAATAPALALDINLTFAPSVSDFGANTNSMTSAVAYAAQTLDNDITDPITINITVNGASGSSVFGESWAYYAPGTSGTYSYAQVLSALTADATQPAQQIAVATLPATDPSPAGGPYAIPTAEAKALGLLSATNTASDGSVTFGAGFNWTFDPNNRAVLGESDFIGVAFHELTEAMGRVWGLNTTLETGSPHYVPYDLYRFDGGTTTRDMTNNTNVGFSINGGKTSLNTYNYQFTNSSGTDTEDPDDWGIGVSNQYYQNSLTNDAFNAYSASSVVNALSSADLTVLNVMGYHLSAAAMSGGTWAGNTSGSWTVPSYWTYPVVPTGGTETVYFAGVPANPNAPITVTLDGNQSAAGLVFNVTNANGYTLAKGSGGTLSLGTQGGGSITVVAGSHAITAPMTLEGPLTVYADPGTALQLSGPIGQASAGTSFTLNGPGTLIYSAAGSFTGNTTVNSGTFEVTGGLLTTSELEVGLIGPNAGSTFIQTSGTVQAGGSGQAGLVLDSSPGYPVASYSFSGGQLTVVSECVGYYGTGSFVQYGGTHTVTGGLVVGGQTDLSSGTYSLRDGLLSADTERIGNNSTGSFVQLGGMNSVSSDLVLGYGTAASGSYNLQHGTLSAPLEEIGWSGSGSFSQSGGTHAVAIDGLYIGYNLGSSGTYTMTGGSLSAPGAVYVGGEYVGYNGNGSFVQSGGTNTVPALLSLAYETSASGTYRLSGSGVLSAGTEAVGFEGQASFTQSGGTNSASLLAAGFAGSGSYGLSGNGQLKTTNEYVGYLSVGSFAQSGGNNAVAAGLFIGEGGGSNGSYNLSGGSLYAANTYVGYSSTGAFAQSGGTHSASILYVGYNQFVTATYSLSGNGVLSAPAEHIGWQGTGAFTQSGGSNVTTTLDLGGVNTTTSSGVYTLNNGSLSASGEVVGLASVGSFSQSGGVNSATAYLYVGDNAGQHGSYILSNGQLSAPYEFVGLSGYGSFTQSGGTNTATSSDLTVGVVAFSSGTYGLSGNGVLSAPAEYIGYQGTGSFAQSGGSNEVSGTLTLAYSNGSTGTYNLNGGLLRLGGLSQGNGTTSFSIGAATFQAGASFATSVPITLSQAGGTAVFDTSGYSLTLNGALSGAGGLQKISQGTLVLAASNGYTGPTTLTAGMLEAANGNSGSATGSNTVTLNGGVLAAGPAGGTIAGQVVAGSAPFSIAPGAALSSGYGTLNLFGGLVTNSYTKLLLNLNLTSSSGSGSNGVKIYSGDLINFNGSDLNIGGGQIAVVDMPTQTGDYRLFDDATLTGGPASLIYLTLPNQSGTSYVLSTAVDTGYIDLVVGVGNAGASGGTWTHNGNGSWATGGNWSGSLFPSSGTVTLGSPGGSINVTLDGYCSAGALVFTSSNANGYTLSQGTGGALTLGTSAGGSIAVNNGSHTISAPLQMAGNLAVSVANGASLQLSGALSESATGTSFTFNGPGTLNYSATGTFTGNTTVNGGTLNLTGGYLPGGPSEIVYSTLVQSGGNNVVSPAGYYNALYVQGGGAYTLSGTGAISAPTEWVSYNGTGAFTQTGGTNMVANYFAVGYGAYGTYGLSGGLLTVSIEQLGSEGANGVFTQTGGTHSVSSYLYIGYSGPGSYYLTGGTSGGGGLLSAQTEYLGISNGGGYFSQSAGTNSASFLYAGYSGGSGEYVLSGSGMLSAAYEYFGYNSNYTGAFYQSGGTNTVAFYLCLGNNFGDNGAYNLSGGSLTVSSVALNGAEYIGYDGNGVFTQSGGTHTVPVPLYLGYNADGNGTYNLNSGSLSAASEYVGYSGSGTFTQTGGTHTVGTASPNFSFLFVGENNGSSGTYNLGGGSLWCGGQELVGDYGNGTFSQSGGYNTAAQIVLGSNVGSSGSYSLTNGNLSCQTAEIIGGAGNGAFTQAGGSNTCWLIVGYASGSSGTYQLGGGQLAALYETVGNYGTGAFQQMGGNNVITTYALYMAAAPGSSGSYSLSGGYLSAPTEYVGYGGNATFTQTGGTNSVGPLVLGENGSTGTYNLGGGLLSLSNVYNAGGTAAFNFSSGTFQTATSFTTYLPINLCQPGSSGVFDTSGNSLTLAGPLSGPGGLIAAGGGTLLLAVSNNFTGTSLVASGTLLLGDSNALSGSTFDTSGNGTLNFNLLAAANFGGLQGSGNLVLTNANSTDVALTVGYNNDDTTFSGTLSDTRGGGSLTKVGTGTLVLTGTNTYNGGTFVEDGTMIVTNNEGLADGSNLTVGEGFAGEDSFLPTEAGSDGVVVPAQSASPPIAPVPEPDTLALIAFSLCIAAFYRKCRR